MNNTSLMPASFPNELVEMTDPQSGRIFYANIVTGECTWDKPLGAIILFFLFGNFSERVSINRKQKDPSKVEWWELFDDNHKLPYFYNTQTGETEWLRPDDGHIIPLIAIQNSAIGKRVSIALQRVSMMSQDIIINPTPITGVISGMGQKTLQNVSPGMNRSNSKTQNLYTVSQSPTQSNINLEKQPFSPPQQPYGSPGSYGSPLIQQQLFKGSTNTPFGQQSPQVRDIQLNQQFQQYQDSLLQKQARLFGIGNPVNNPDMAENMNPLKSNKNNSSFPKNQFNDSPYEVKTLPKDLQIHINQFQIDGFAKKYFAQHRRGIFRRTVPVEKMLQWQKDSLKVPLMIMNKELHKEAISCFKLIQKVMGDKGNVSDTREDTQALLDKGINKGSLRDEIYVQITKQLNKNPKTESIIRGWRLLCCIVIAFPPSKNFEDYIKSFIMKSFDIHENHANVFSRHIHKKLIRICKTGPRGKTITFQEIERAQDAPFTPTPFGETLADIMLTQQRQWPELKLPRILPFLAEAVLNLGGCNTEGVFRVPGDIDAVTDLKCRIEKGEYDIRGIVDPNVAGSLLKSWLRELADPLIPQDAYDQCVKVGGDEMAEDGPQRSYQIVELLPDINRLVVQYMIRFLRIVGDPKNQPNTKMSVGNLAMVFAPNFLRCPRYPNCL
ncbi:hypothetical protein HK096_000378 [Nowakowskiella sp. JEL0078]|nr:hypothetical protein HK096_000378 [Nowakowskiella sp. JEL0078]